MPFIYKKCAKINHLTKKYLNLEVKCEYLQNSLQKQNNLKSKLLKIKLNILQNKIANYKLEINDFIKLF
jgi:hypothetical protein